VSKVGLMTTITEAAGKTIGDISIGQVGKTQQMALARLHLYSIGETHRIFAEASTKMRAAVIQHASSNTLDGLGLIRAHEAAQRIWIAAYKEWNAALTEWLRTAAAIPFGTWAVLHDRFFLPQYEKAQRAIEEGRSSTLEYVFNPQHQAVLDAAYQRVYADGIPLSTRIWNLDHASRAGIDQVIYTGAANGASAWDIAQQLEQYLGASQGCPRWTRTRLYKLTKKEIAGGRRTGLYSGAECKGQGVAYKALRLARNEIQTIHHMATDRVMQALPFVQEEQIHLSSGHPVDDECDQVVAGGPKGGGVYPKGTISLPIHVQCLCYKTAVLIKPEELTTKLRGWMDGSQAWPEMDGYASAIGGDPLVSLAKMRLAQDLTEWAFGDPYSG